MIRINLTPPEELENPLWMVPDILLGALVCLIAYFAVDLYLDTERQQIDVIVAEQQKIQAESAKFAPFVEQLKRLEGQIADVNKQLGTLKGVSGELVEKYAPVIAIEHIQNLKPQGVWFTRLSVSGQGGNAQQRTGARGGQGGAQKDGDGVIRIEATALDNLLVAELMASLRATKTQAVEAGDMRTQVYFEGVTLSNTTRAPAPNDLVVLPGGLRMERPPSIVTFALEMTFKSNPVRGARPIASFQDFYPVDTRFDVAIR